jgi:hypothetical protein
MSERWTQIIIVALPLLIGLLDYFLLRVGGNAATISAFMLRLRMEQPYVALSTAYSFAVLMGHLFFPDFTEKTPPGYEVIARMFFVLSPTFYAMIMILFGDPPDVTEILKPGAQWWFAAKMLAASIIGGLAGHYGLPQHLFPGSPATQIAPAMET